MTLGQLLEHVYCDVKIKMIDSDTEVKDIILLYAGSYSDVPYRFIDSEVTTVNPLGDYLSICVQYSKKLMPVSQIVS